METLREKNKRLEPFLNSVVKVRFHNIREWDYPDFSDATIFEAEIEEPNGDRRDATEEELDIMNDNRDFFYEELYNQAIGI